MLTYICMGMIVLFLAFEVLYKAQLRDVNEGFFDLTNSTAMRGFWCLVVIFVHTPQLYQNRIQDMIGSFAYIGVTFFFMTSGYGLKIGVQKNPDSMKTFWRKRLPKILIPYYIIRIFVYVIKCLNGEKVNWVEILIIREWVPWLLICYLMFWIVYRFDLAGKYKDYLLSGMIVLFSLVIFYLSDYITEATWPTEIYGFIWGILLANTKIQFRDSAVRHWLVRSLVLCAMTGITGIVYLNLKQVYFWGSYLIKIALGFVILWFILQLTTRISIGNKVSLFLGGISYEIYLLHGHVFDVLKRHFVGMDSGLFILVTIITTVALSALIHLISKPLSSKAAKALKAL